jgi:hypothetical protein
MELIFGEGTDGDTEATIFGPLADGEYCVTVEWNDVTDPAPGGEITGHVVGIINTRPQGELTVRKMDDDGDPIGEPFTIPIHHITRMEIH